MQLRQVTAHLLTERFTARHPCRHLAFVKYRSEAGGGKVKRWKWSEVKFISCRNTILLHFTLTLFKWSGDACDTLQYSGRRRGKRNEWWLGDNSCFSFRVLVSFTLALCHTVMAYRDTWTETEPLLKLLMTHRLFFSCNMWKCLLCLKWPLLSVRLNVSCPKKDDDY